MFKFFNINVNAFSFSLVWIKSGFFKKYLKYDYLLLFIRMICNFFCGLF